MFILTSISQMFQYICKQFYLIKLITKFMSKSNTSWEGIIFPKFHRVTVICCLHLSKSITKKDLDKITIIL